MDFNKMIPELSVFDIEQTKRFYNDLGFKIEYERPEEKFVFMSFQDSQFMFEYRRANISFGKRNKFFNSR